MTLDLDTFEGLLKSKLLGRAPGWRNEVWQTIDSTNARALSLAADGAPAGVVVAARQQTAGRGRLGRTWVSPPDTGLYVSFLFRPDLKPVAMPLISLAAGVAVARCIEITCGLKPGLKWVNDIVYGGKKIGGILCEMQVPPALVVGIGINLRLHPEDMPPEISQTADSVERITGLPIDTNVLAAELCLQLESSYNLLAAGERTAIITEWKHYSSTIGSNVIATCAGKQTSGRAVDLAPDGALILQTDDGAKVTLHAGEVSIRNADGTYV